MKSLWNCESHFISCWTKVFFFMLKCLSSFGYLVYWNVLGELKTAGLSKNGSMACVFHVYTDQSVCYCTEKSDTPPQYISQFIMCTKQNSLYMSICSIIFSSRCFWFRATIYANRNYLKIYRTRNPELLTQSSDKGPRIIGDVYIHPTAQVDSTAVVCFTHTLMWIDSCTYYTHIDDTCRCIYGITWNNID